MSTYFQSSTYLARIFDWAFPSDENTTTCRGFNPLQRVSPWAKKAANKIELYKNSK